MVVLLRTATAGVQASRSTHYVTMTISDDESPYPTGKTQLHFTVVLQ